MFLVRFPQDVQFLNKGKVKTTLNCIFSLPKQYKGTSLLLFQDHLFKQFFLQFIKAGVGYIVGAQGVMDSGGSMRYPDNRPQGG